MKWVHFIASYHRYTHAQPLSKHSKEIVGYAFLHTGHIKHREAGTGNIGPIGALTG